MAQVIDKTKKGGVATERPMANSRRLNARAHEIIPGGSHTYAKCDDQFPESMPVIVARGSGCHVWDVDGNEYIEYGMGLRAVALGHAFAPVVEAAREALSLGTNFTRPAAIEIECAEVLQSLIPSAEMVKFCKNGSDALDGAVKLARAHTGRTRIAICGDHPFFSIGDWFIGTTAMPGGIPQWVRDQTLKFKYNDVQSLADLFDRYPNELCCVIMEASRLDEPQPGFLQAVHDLCRKRGAIFVLDEMITGFRWHRSGAQHVYGISPDLTTFGKAIANGFSVSALTGRRDLMERGGLHSANERVFLLSTTHGAEVHTLAAAMATMRFYAQNDVTGVLHERGERLRKAIAETARAVGVADYFQVLGRASNLVYATRDAEGKPSNDFRTLFLQETVARGMIAPSLVVSYSHSEADLDATVEIVGSALEVYRDALRDGVHRYLRGRPVKPAMRPFA